MKSILISLMIMIGLGSQANAGILIEPYFNLILSGKAGSEDLSGNVIGARLGYGFAGFSLGLDAEVAGGIKSDSSTITPGSMGVFVAYQFPILLRGYATYSPLFKGKDGSTESTGTGSKIGVQYTGLPFVAIGIESANFNITKVKAGSTEVDADINGNYTSLVVSLPFDF